MRQSQIAVLEDVASSPLPARLSSARSSLGGGTSIPLATAVRKERVGLCSFNGNPMNLCFCKNVN